MQHVTQSHASAIYFAVIDYPLLNMMPRGGRMTLEIMVRNSFKTPKKALGSFLKRVGARIRNLRYSRGWKQEDLAAHLDIDITRSAISYLENGRRAASLETLLAIASALEVDPVYLLLDPHNDKRHSAAEAILLDSSYSALNLYEKNVEVKRRIRLQSNSN